MKKAPDFYVLLAISFVTVLLSANVMADKPVSIGHWVIPAGLLLFPLTYLMGAVIAEVYGFSRSRQVVISAMVANLFMATMLQIAVWLPSRDWPLALAYEQVLGRSTRLMLISIFAYGVGELINAYVVVRLKQYCGVTWRMLCGSWIGEAFETFCFIPLAFYPTLTPTELTTLMLGYYAFKIVYALCSMPIATRLVRFLKTHELHLKTA